MNHIQKKIKSYSVDKNLKRVEYNFLKIKILSHQSFILVQLIYILFVLQLLLYLLCLFDYELRFEFLLIW
jgi:hypothetical protein